MESLRRWRLNKAFSDIVFSLPWHLRVFGIRSYWAADQFAWFSPRLYRRVSISESQILCFYYGIRYMPNHDGDGLIHTLISVSSANRSNGKYGLVSGWRRCLGHRLHSSHFARGGRFSAICALIFVSRPLGSVELAIRASLSRKHTKPIGLCHECGYDLRAHAGSLSRMWDHSDEEGNCFNVIPPTGDRGSDSCVGDCWANLSWVHLEVELKNYALLSLRCFYWLSLLVFVLSGIGWTWTEWPSQRSSSFHIWGHPEVARGNIE